MRETIRTVLRTVMPYVLSVGAVLTVFRAAECVYHPFIVSGPSMLPAYHGGEIVKTDPVTTPLARGDVCIVHADEMLMIKRVAGCPGETVSIRDGVWYVNDDPVEIAGNGVFQADMDNVSLGEDEYFFLGDNREHSMDSRAYGPVAIKEVKRVVTGKLFCFPAEREER